MVYLDFETRSKIELKKADSWVYSKHKSTDILCMSYVKDDGLVTSYVPDLMDGYAPPVDWVNFVDDPNQLFTAHNIFFEWTIYKHILVDRYGWPPIAPGRWRCTAAAGSYRTLPISLEGAASVVLDIKKDMAGHKLMLKLTKPRKPSKKNRDKFFSDKKDFDRLYQYCNQDVEVTRALHRVNGDIPAVDMPIFHITQMINRRGIKVDVAAIRGALKVLDIVMSEYLGRLAKMTDNEINTFGQRDKILNWMAKNGVNTSDLTAGNVNDLLKNGVSVLNHNTNEFEYRPLPTNVHKLLSLRREANRTSTAKYISMLHKADRDDQRVRNILVYCGPSTRRWAGRGIQIQNFPKGTFKFTGEKQKEQTIQLIKNVDIDALKKLGPVPEILSSLLRSMLIAGKNKKFVVTDYAQIEARISMWLVQELDALEVFKSGRDIYKIMASTIFNVPFNEVTKAQRFLGKQAILGLGYQMGAPKFKATCKIFGVEIPDQLAAKVVKSYRSKYKKIVQNWNATENAALKALQTGQPQRANKVTFYIEGKYLKCKLPSGQDLHFYDPHLVRNRFDPQKFSLAYYGVDSKTHKWTEIPTYGGKLVENIVQSISGDLLRTATVNLESAGWRVVLSIHDELVCEVPDNDDYNVDKMIKLMCKQQSWADGLPVTGEGYEGQRFKK